MKQVLIKINDDTCECLASDSESLNEYLHQIIADLKDAIKFQSDIKISMVFRDPNETISELEQKIKNLEDEIDVLKNSRKTGIDWEPYIRPLTTPEPNPYPFGPIVTYGAGDNVSSTVNI